MPTINLEQFKIQEAKTESTNKDSIEKIFPPQINKSHKYPIVFLAGPIQGAPKWHEELSDKLTKNASDKKFIIASPKMKYKPEEFDYEKQVNWESHYLEQAAKNGIIIFWLAKEDKHDPKRAYAQTTRYEIAEWLTKSEYDKNIKIIVGIEEGFSGDRYITKKIKDHHKKFLPIYNNLEDLAKAVIKAL